MGSRVPNISRELGDESFAPQDTEREGGWQLHSANNSSNGVGRQDTPEVRSRTTNDDLSDDDRGESVDPSAFTHTAKSVSTAGLQPRSSSPCTIARVTKDFEVTCAMPGFFRVTPPEKTKPRSRPIKHHPNLSTMNIVRLLAKGRSCRKGHSSEVDCYFRSAVLGGLVVSD